MGTVGSNLSTPLMIYVLQTKFIQHYSMLLNSKKLLKCKMLTFKCFSKMTILDLVVASTRYHLARLLKYYPRRPCAPSLVKSRILRLLRRHFLLFQQIFFILVCIHEGNSRVNPQILVSGPKPCGGNYHYHYQYILTAFWSCSIVLIHFPCEYSDIQNSCTTVI